MTNFSPDFLYIRPPQEVGQLKCKGKQERVNLMFLTN